MDASAEAEDLWEGLNLGGLLNDLARENESALAQAKRLQARRDPFKKHNKMLKNPAYSVLMDRYGAAPPKPKLLAKATLSRLSDPVKGRHVDHDSDASPHRVRVVRDTKYHPRKSNSKQPSANSSRHRSTKRHSRLNDDRYDHSPIRKEAWVESSPSPAKHPRPSACSPIHDTGGGGGGGTFFLTGTNDDGEDYDDDGFESPPPSPASLRRKMQQLARGPEVSPIELGCVTQSPAGRREVYSPPDIYSPRTKEALRVSFNKENNKAIDTALPPPKKTFNALQFTSNKTDLTRHGTRKSEKPSTLGQRRAKPKLSKGKSKAKAKATSKTRGSVVTGRARGSSLERQSKVGLRRKKAAAGGGDELSFDAPSKRVQLLSNKMQASKSSRAGASGGGRSDKNSSARNRQATEGSLLRSSSVKSTRSSSTVRDGGSEGMSGSRSAPSLRRNQASSQRLPTIAASLSSSSLQKPTTLPALRAKNLLGRKSVTPALQDRYASILQESKDACKADPPRAFNQKATGPSRQSTLHPISEKQVKMNRKLKNREAVKKKAEEVVNSPGQLAAEREAQRKEEERQRREEQERRMEARAKASKKREEAEYRSKIRQAAEANALKSKQKGNVETVDDKLVTMFKTHCARVVSKLTEADKLSAEFKSLIEFDGLSSTDRLKLRPDGGQDNNAPPPVPEPDGNKEASATETEAAGSCSAFLSKPLMM